MKSKTKNSILIISVIGLIFLIYNSIKWRYWELELLLLSKILFIIGLISFALYFRKRDWKKGLTTIMAFSFSLSLVLGIFLSYQYYEWNKYTKMLNEYEEIETCDELKERFAIDLEKNEIKYFQFGFAVDIELQKKLKKTYEIESFGMGCLVDPKMECYNKLVHEYLKEKYNYRIDH